MDSSIFSQISPKWNSQILGKILWMLQRDLYSTILLSLVTWLKLLRKIVVRINIKTHNHWRFICCVLTHHERVIQSSYILEVAEKSSFFFFFALWNNNCIDITQIQKRVKHVLFCSNNVFPEQQLYTVQK